MAPGATERGLSWNLPLEPLARGHPRGNVCDPKVEGIWGGMPGFLQAFLLSGPLQAFLLPPTQEQGAGWAGGLGRSRRCSEQPDLPQLFPAPKENTGCLQRWDHPRREGRKKPFSRALLLGKWGRGRRGTGRGPRGFQRQALS